MSKVWFITGVSSGFGLEIALKALEYGHTVIGAVRNRQRAAKEVEKIESQGGTCLELDVTDASACSKIFEEAQKLHGRIDVLVNNAGMSYLGPIEDFTDEEAKAQMEVNFHGPLRLIQAALPGFRDRKSGTIVNITSIAGINALPSVGLYAASKFALEGLSEALAPELEEHNIHVLIVEPGQFRTNFLSAFKTPASGMPNMEHYSTAKKTFAHFEEIEGTQKGDPVKAATRIVEVVSGTGTGGKLRGKILRLPLGPDCVQRFEGKVKSMSDDLETAREVSMSTDIS